MTAPDLRALIEAARAAELPRLIGELEAAKGAAWVRLATPPPIDDYGRSRAAACTAAGLPAGHVVPGGLIPYDLRRTAIRNMVRAGVSPTVAKRVSSHLTDATFERYNMVDEEDLRLAMRLTANYVSVLPMAAAQGREHGSVHCVNWLASSSRTEHAQPPTRARLRGGTWGNEGLGQWQTIQTVAAVPAGDP